MPRRVLPILPAAALLLAACASGNPETPEVGERSTNLSIQMSQGRQNLNLRTTAEINVVHDTISGDPGDLFSLLPAVYEEVGVPITSVNAAAKTLGALEVRARGDFAGERVSKWIDCGTSITGNVADQREVYVTVLTQIEALEETEGVSGVSTHLTAYAVQAGRAGNRTDCGTSGRLERRIASALRAMAGGSGG
mgnify:CR=1 FL=1